MFPISSDLMLTSSKLTCLVVYVQNRTFFQKGIKVKESVLRLIWSSDTVPSFQRSVRLWIVDRLRVFG